ncbi:MAG TPA: hypothetical protein VN924_22285 [Bryobacteraceae bacterium]|nr:hypothetical protein [Bryobacteraceae bacterium]
MPILKALIAQIANGTFEVKPGSLFPALHRMEEAGWDDETEQWERISLAVAGALRAT